MIDGPEPTFPIVGVGASAGGLEAFTEFLSGVPASPGMAFVLMQHLDPDHKSLLAELLGRASPLPVQVAQDGQHLEPDNVYVLPAQTQVSVSEGALKLEPRPEGLEPFHPVDVFFHSLAADAGTAAIGVVLSGTGSDGGAGVAEIQKHGGLTYAQSPISARFSDMPLAAIAAGATGNLEASAIVRAIISRLSSRSALGHDQMIDRQSGSAEDESFRLILQVLYERKGINLALYKGHALKRRVLRRMEKLGIRSFAEYLRVLQTDVAEGSTLCEDIFVKVTSFFRDKETFDYLKKVTLPAILSCKGKDQNLRIWVPGCATGEEVYSIAICIAEIQAALPGNPTFEMFGTDISDVALGCARLGEYDASVARDVGSERLERFFARTEVGYRILPIIRSRCIFSKQNVAQDPPISGVDLISCRNLMIYFKSSTQRIVLEKLRYALNPCGQLVLGSAEDTLATKGLFCPVAREHRIFEVNPSIGPVMRLPRPLSLQPTDNGHEQRFISNPSSLVAQTELTAHVDHVIQSVFVPPGVVLNSRFEIMQFRGDTSPFLLNPPGIQTNDVFKLCRDGLGDVLRHVLDKVTLSGQRGRVEGAMQVGAKRQRVRIDVIPFYPSAVLDELRMDSSGPGERCYVAMFARVRKSKNSDMVDVAAGSETDRLRAELAETKTFLGNLMLQKQQAIEELRSANEEIHSANEELQSSNQELVTAREESMATNDELRRVNADLLASSSKLDQLNSDIVNLLGSLLIPVVIVSEDLRIKLFTEAASRLFKLSPDSQGRSAALLSEQPGLSVIGPLIADVLNTLSSRESEIFAVDGCWYSVRARPYRTDSNRVRGVVLAFIDVTEIKKTHQAMRAERDLSAAVIRSSPSPLLILDGSFRIVSANRSFDVLFGVDSKDFVGVPVFSLWGARWDSAELRQLVHSDWASDTQLSDFPIHNEFPLEEGMHVTLATSKIRGESPESSRYIMSLSDVGSERKLRESAEQSWAVALSANQAKSDFLANMSHEMRSPLMAIMGFSESIADPCLSESDRRDFAARIISNSEDLIELIDEILDLSKIEAGKFSMEPVDFDLAPLLEEAFNLLRNRAERAQVRLEVRFSGPMPMRVTSCPRRLRQIIHNVVGNAIKFTAQGGQVVVDIAAEDRKLIIDVTDSGCGIAASKQQQLFMPFSQADTSISRRFGGTGLGLALSRQLARAMGGDVILVKSTEGVGSVFRIAIGTGAAHPGLLTSSPKDVANDGVVGPSDGCGVRPIQRLSGKRILLVEDSPDNQKIIGLFLAQSGATVAYAVDGFEAISFVEKSAFDLILMDVQMPSLDGYSATRRLRALGYTLPIVALTANAMLGEHERALEAGCNGYISKPVRRRCLIDTVERHLNEAQGCC